MRATTPKVISGCDQRFDVVVAKATNPSPALRYASPRELAVDLETIRNSTAARKGPQLRTAASPASALAAPRFAGRTTRKSVRHLPSAGQSSPVATIAIVAMILLGIILLLEMLNKH